MKPTDLIPHRPPFLFLDEIVEAGGGRLLARRTWRAEEDFYRGHYPGAPITPGVLLCEAVFQAGAALLASEAAAAAAVGGARAGVPLLAKVSEARFRRPVKPGETVDIEVRRVEEVGGFHLMRGTVSGGGQRVLSVEFAVAWKEPGGAGAGP